MKKAGCICKIFSDIYLYPYLEYYLDSAYMRLAKYIWPYFDDGVRLRYSALFCRILQILGKMTLVPCKLTENLVDDLKSAVEGFNREGSDS